MRLDSQSFYKHIQKHELFGKDELLLVAVSGGLDSMVLVHLLSQAGYRFHIAHVNFGLRGEESDGDEQFVIDFSNQHQIPLHVYHASDVDFKSDKSSIQEDARKLRYRWFRELKKVIDAYAIVLAHHQDDQSETILHQFVRGGMLAALRGMHSKHDDLVRPLLTFSRNEILEYAQSNKVAWREDSSNASSKYTRNFIRHDVMPMLEKINPDIRASLAERATIFHEMEHMVEHTTQALLESMLTTSNGHSSLDIDELTASPYQQLLLWKWLSPAGFSTAQLQEVQSIFSAQSGSRVESATHIVLKDRETLKLYPKSKQEHHEEVIDELPYASDLISISNVTRDEVRFDDTYIQFVDKDKLHFPLVLRPWREGDKWQPYGLRGTQKISDFLVRKKISVLEKPEVRVLVDANDTIIATRWRISELVKVDAHSSHVVRMEWK
jgi:tRNA(Ile)-lysidine synthase